MFESIKQKISNLKDKAKTLRKKIGKPAFLCATFALSPALVACYGADFPEPDYQVGDPCYENFCDRYGMLNVCENDKISEQIACECNYSRGVCETEIGKDCTEADNKCIGTVSITCVEGKTVAKACGQAGCDKATGQCNVANPPEAGTKRCMENTCSGNAALLCLNGQTVRQECGEAGCNAATGTCNKACTDGESSCVIELKGKKPVGVLRECQNGTWIEKGTIEDPAEMTKKGCE